MHLNLLNQTVIVSGAILSAEHSDVNPRFGVSHAVNNRVFKFTPTHECHHVTLIERVSLEELFGGIPQDVSTLTYHGELEQAGEGLLAHLNTDYTTEEPVVLEDGGDFIDPSDKLGHYFLLWKKLVGLTGLYRNEVDLCHDEEYLYADASKAKLFTGVVKIKFK